MDLRVCTTCRRSIPTAGDCAFCVPMPGTNRLRAGYAVVAAVSSWGLAACGGSAACAFIGDATPVDDAGADDLPALAFPDAAPDTPPIDAAVDGSDAADAGDASTDATKDAGPD